MQPYGSIAETPLWYIDNSNSSITSTSDQALYKQGTPNTFPVNPVKSEIIPANYYANIKNTISVGDLMLVGKFYCLGDTTNISFISKIDKIIGDSGSQYTLNVVLYGGYKL